MKLRDREQEERAHKLLQSEGKVKLQSFRKNVHLPVANDESDDQEGGKPGETKTFIILDLVNKHASRTYHA